MATATTTLVDALLTTAARLRTDVDYKWTHLGACNCGHLAQTLTPYTREELRHFALQRRGDWAEQAAEFCPSSGYPIDLVLQAMVDAGMTRQDIANLERLDDHRIVSRLPMDLRRELNYRNRHHVAAYMVAWADLLAAELPDSEPVGTPKLQALPGGEAIEPPKNDQEAA